MSDGSGWKLHETEQLRRWASLSAKQRLDWLWNAKLFAARALRAAQARGDAEQERTTHSRE